MSSPYVGEIRMFGGNFAPVGWLFCDGQALQISEYDTLFNLIGTTYGGDGQSTFALPDLRGRWPVHQGRSTTGTTYVMGQAAGVETVTLTQQQIPAHSHTPLGAVAAATATSPAGAVWSASTSPAFAVPSGALTTQMAADALEPAGGSQPHDNLPPYLAVSFIISLYGIYPSQS